MKHRQQRTAGNPSLGFWIGAAAWAALSSVAWPAAAQSGAVDIDVSSERPARDVVVVTRRPLRTFRGDTVRVGRATSRDLSIGVVRPFREGARFSRRRGLDSFGRFSFDRPFSRSFNRRFTGANDLHIGVVRPFREFDPIVRNRPTTVTNPFAPPETPETPRSPQSPVPSAGPVPSAAAEPSPFDRRPVTVGPVFPETAAHDTAERRSTPLSSIAVDRGDPWSLLNAGRYREALERFDAVNASDAAEIRTGRALAAVLSGDLAAGGRALPDRPVLPAGVALSDTARQRVELTAEFLYADQPATQAKLRQLLLSAAGRAR